MNELVEITINKELRSNPKELANMIATLSKDIKDCRNDLTGIKDRSFWKRTFSNNTRDLADALIKQNDTISTFVNIVQVLIGFNLHNAVFLGWLYDEMTKVSGEAKTTNNEYFKLARDYIGETLKAAKNTNEKFDEFGNSISNINTELKEKEQIDKEQSEILSFLKQKYAEKEKLDIQQSEDIEHLKRKNNEKDELDTKQSVKINELEKEIEVLKQLLEEHTKVKIKEIDDKLGDFAGNNTDLNIFIKNLSSKYSKLQIALIIYMILSIAAIIVLFVS